MDFAFDETTKVVSTYVPNLLGALAILVVGWLVARIIAALVAGALRRTQLDNKLARWIAGDQPGKAIPIEIWISRAVFYLLMIFVLVGFFQALQLTLPSEPLNRLLVRLFQFVPQLVGAAVLLLIAWVLASIVQALLSRVLKAAKVDARLAEQTESTKPVSLTQTIADTAYWLVFLLFLPAVLDALGLAGLLTPVQGMINKLLNYLPNIFTAALILAVGWFVARIVRGIVTNFLSAVGADQIGQRVGLNAVLGGRGLSAVVGLIVYVLILVPVLIGALDALSLEAITRPTSNMLNTILDTLPNIFAAGLILLVAYISGKLVESLVSNLLGGIGFDAILVRLGLGRTSSPGQRTPSGVVGYLVFVAIMLVAATEAARQLGFLVLVDLITRFMVFAGEVILGLVILAIGLYLANVAASVIETSNAAQARLLAVAARVSIIILAAAMALRQMGVASDIINLAFGLLLGAIAVAVALAVGLGGRDIAARELNEVIQSIKEKK
ncbi:MAG TPA: mechanosensitive ion channel [Candidatus Acidoferrales bacterium]|nr:mechanosensitive ion channel [Candidatus Acidoferrales bacterium]